MILKISFNPCCNGINHKHKDKFNFDPVKFVLILVVMESIINN